MLDLLKFLSLRYWLRHRGGFFLATLGVTLGLAVFVSIQVANHSVLASFAASLEAVSGRANLQIRGGSNGLPESVYTRLKTRDDARIQAVAPLMSRTLFSPDLKTSILVTGADVFAEADFRDYDLNAASDASTQSPNEARGSLGPFTTFLTQPDAIAISGSLARKHNLKIGSRFQLFVGAKRETFRVAAIMQSERGDEAFGGDFALLDIASAQEAFGDVGKLSQIDLIVDEAQLESVRRDLQKIVPSDARVGRPSQRGAEVAGLLSAFQLNLTALSCIAVFVGAFLIYNAIAIAVVRRRGEVGVLRAVGVEPARLTRMFLIEAALIGLCGSLAGLFGGILLARFTLGAVSKTVSALYISVHARDVVVPAWLWFGAPLGGTLLAVLSAYPAAREAGHVSPRAALQRITLHQATARFAPRMALGGAAMLGLAWVLCLPWLSGRTVYAGFAACFFTLAGFALLAPIVTLGGGHLAQHFGGALIGVEGTLAGSYLRRAINRSSLVIAALMVSLAMSIGLSVMVGSFRGTVVEWVEGTIAADLYIAPANGFAGDLGPGLPLEVVRAAETLPQVRTFETIRGADLTLGKQPVFIAANTLPTLLSGDRKTRFVETTGTIEQAKLAFTQGRALLVSERFKNLVGLGAGDSVTLPTPRGTHSFPIAGVFYDYTPNECVVYMPQNLYRRYWNDYAIDGIALFLKPGARTSDVQSEFNRRFGAQYQLTLLPNRELRQSVFDTFDQTFAVTYALQLIAIIVAAIGIFDTLIALLLERGRELATLRAVGASRAQILKMTAVEFALIGLLSWGLGVAAGLCLAWELITVINRQFFGWTIGWSLPVGSLFQALILALLAAVGAGILPARAAAKRNIAQALQVE